LGRYEAELAFANGKADSKNLAYLKHYAQAAAKAWDKTLGFL
jgi:carboxymethylenebutenolidase